MIRSRCSPASRGSVLSVKAQDSAPFGMHGIHNYSTTLRKYVYNRLVVFVIAKTRRSQIQPSWDHGLKVDRVSLCWTLSLDRSRV